MIFFLFHLAQHAFPGRFTFFSRRAISRKFFIQYNLISDGRFSCFIVFGQNMRASLSSIWIAACAFVRVIDYTAFQFNAVVSRFPLELAFSIGLRPSIGIRKLNDKAGGGDTLAHGGYAPRLLFIDVCLFSNEFLPRGNDACAKLNNFLASRCTNIEPWPTCFIRNGTRAPAVVHTHTHPHISVINLNKRK